MESIRQLLDRLADSHTLPAADWHRLLSSFSEEDAAYLFTLSRAAAQAVFGNLVYTRGLIEFTSYCKNDCLYCGLRRSNRRAQRYRLSEADILSCCAEGYGLGFRTFVLQGGEDPLFSDDTLCALVEQIKHRWSDCAVTLSVGEREKNVYQSFYNAGADRYLLRHETADPAHYTLLHPPELSWQRRMDCLWALKEIGFQVGAGFMVGSPGQTTECLVKEMQFLEQLQPHMVGIGPFLPHSDTPFRSKPPGSEPMTLFLLGCIRLLLPKVLLPATTALGTVAEDGRERGILAGANVVMPNLSPLSVREKYKLYDNKICTGEESAQCRDCLSARMRSIGYTLAVDRGDSPLIKRI